MDEALSRTRMLLGEEAMARLAAARVAVFGLGGVGGYAVEALARSGIGALELVDDDVFSPSNRNRQLLATERTMGMDKTRAAAERVREIAPWCAVTARKLFFLPETEGEFDFSGYDYVVDAIDTVTGKLRLVICAQRAGTPIISAMGTGNKLDPAALEVADIYATSSCPLARVMRRELRRLGVERLKVVYTREPPRRPLLPPGEEPPASRRDIPGSTAFVPAAAGLLLAAEVVRDLAGL